MVPKDSELIEQAVKGNISAFEQLIYRYDETVLTIASRFTNNSEDAKDIYQEVLIRVYYGLEKFQFRSEFSTWLFRITTNVCLTHKTRKKKLSEVSLDNGDEENMQELGISNDRADSTLHDGEIAAKIDRVLKELSPQQRLVFTLRHYEEYKLKEIAMMMNCAEGTVKKYLFEATQKMRTHLQYLYE
jgi:RNA polymerase sigma-70 factor, ECF subfamily